MQTLHRASSHTQATCFVVTSFNGHSTQLLPFSLRDLGELDQQVTEAEIMRVDALNEGPHRVINQARFFERSPTLLLGGGKLSFK